MSQIISQEEISETKLTVEIKNRRPIELIDLTESFLSLADQYKRFASSNLELAGAPEVRLYIKEIRSGSVITDLIAMAPAAVPIILPFVENANSIVEFSKFLQSAYEYFTGNTEAKPVLEKADFNNLSKFIEPTAKDNGSQTIISNTINGNVTLNFNLNSREANAAQNAIRREIAQLREPEVRVHHQALLYWYQARGDARSNVGDRGIIESISTSPVKVVFDSEKVKALMLLQDSENPFRSAYIVDVFVETVSGKPALYKIIQFHDRLEKP